MKSLNFYPYYEDLLRSKKKTTTFRLANNGAFDEGEEVMLTIGWKEDNATQLHPAKIRKIYRRRIRDLTPLDFQGESRDCKSAEATQLVLSCIYRTVLKIDDHVWVIKFEHESSEA